MKGRKSNVFLLFVSVNVLFFILLFVHARITKERSLPLIREKVLLVERLRLTDLCLFTDARYARNPSVSELNSPFQDSPMSLDHYPSGTIILPPLHLRGK